MSCLIVAMIATVWRRAEVRWFGPGLLATFAFLLLLLSIAAPVTPSPGSRLSVLYCSVVGIAACVIRPRPGLVVGVLGVLSMVVSFDALRDSALRTDRGNAVLLGLNANGIGFLCALGLVVGTMIARRRGVRFKLVGVLVALIGLAGTIQSGSRGAFLASLAGAIVVVLANRLQRVQAGDAAMLAGAGIVLYLASPTAMDWLARAAGRDTTAIATNVTSRESASTYAIHATGQHPLTGVGLFGLDRYSLLDINANFHLSAHNVFIGRFAESGVLSGVCLLVTMALALVGSWRASAALLLPLFAYLCVAGISIDWLADSRLSPLSFLVVGAALVTTDRPRSAAEPEKKLAPVGGSTR